MTVRVFTILICVAALGVTAIPRLAVAWFSKSYPPFEAVHQMAIRNILGSKLTTQQVEELATEQDVVDRDQNATQSHEHAMTGVRATRIPDRSCDDVAADAHARYIKCAEKLIHDQLREAIDDRKKGKVDDAMKPLGWALHPLTDATSPKHEGFQEWSDGEGVFDIARHIFRERTYPSDERKSQLEGAVLYAYDIYMETVPAPEHFFDSAGKLKIPDSYLHR